MINTEFFLYNSHNKNNQESISYRDKNSIKNSKFDPNLPLKIIVHGFSVNKYNGVEYYAMKDKFLKVISHFKIKFNFKKIRLIFLTKGYKC